MMATPPRSARHCRTRSAENNFHDSENTNPNISSPTPQHSSAKPSKSPASKSVPAKKSASSRTPNPKLNPVPAPPSRRGRKFLVAKKNRKARGDGHLDSDERRKEAYEALKASQEGFFSKKPGTPDSPPTENEVPRDQNESSPVQLENPVADDGLGNGELEGSSKVRMMRTRVMENARDKKPEAGGGLVKHLVQAFESLQLIKKKGEVKVEEEEEEEEGEERTARVVNWALPGLHPVEGKALISCSSSAEFVSFGALEEREASKVCSSMDSNRYGEGNN